MVMLAGMGLRAAHKAGLGRLAGRAVGAVARRALGRRGHRGGRGRGFFSVGRKGVVGFTDRHGRQRTMRVSRNAVIGKNLPKHKTIVRLRHNLKRHLHDLRTLAGVHGLVLTPRGRGRRPAPPWRGRRQRGRRG